MSTRNHPASVAELDDALGVPGSQLASKRLASAEEVFEILTGPGSPFSRMRSDRAATAIRQRLGIIAALARNRPPAEFEAWLDNCLKGREQGPGTRDQ